MIKNDRVAYENLVKEFYANFELEQNTNQNSTGFTTRVEQKEIKISKLEFWELFEIGFYEPRLLYLGKDNDWAKISRPTTIARITEEYGVYVDICEPKPWLPPGSPKRNWNLLPQFQVICRPSIFHMHCLSLEQL